MRHFSRLCFFLFPYNLLPKSLDMFFAKFLTIKKNRNFVMRKIKRSFVKLRRKNNSSRIINWSKANYYDFIISRFQLLLFVSFIRVKCKIHIILHGRKQDYAFARLWSNLPTFQNLFLTGDVVRFDIQHFWHATYQWNVKIFHV